MGNSSDRFIMLRDFYEKLLTGPEKIRLDLGTDFSGFAPPLPYRKKSNRKKKPQTLWRSAASLATGNFIFFHVLCGACDDAGEGEEDDGVWAAAGSGKPVPVQQPPGALPPPVPE